MNLPLIRMEKSDERCKTRKCDQLVELVTVNSLVKSCNQIARLAALKKDLNLKLISVLTLVASITFMGTSITSSSATPTAKITYFEIRPVLAEQLVNSSHQCPPTQVQSAPSAPLITCSLDGKTIYKLGATELTSADLSTITLIRVQGSQVINIKFNGFGTKKFGALTARLTVLPNPQNEAAIVINGRVQLAPRINEAIILGNIQINGFSTSSAKDFLNVVLIGNIPGTTCPKPGATAKSGQTNVICQSKNSKLTWQIPNESAIKNKLNLVGTYSGGDDVDAYSLAWKVGAIQYTPPPADVLRACYFQNHVTGSIFFPGELAITHTKGLYDGGWGMLPSNIVRQGSLEQFGDLAWGGWVAFQIDGIWQCAGGTSEAGFLTLPTKLNKAVIYPVWFMNGNALAHGSLKIDPVLMNDWHFSDYSTFPLGPGKFTGPNLAACSNRSRILFLFKKLGKC